MYDQNTDPFLTALFALVSLHLIIVQFVLPAAGAVIGCILARKKNRKWLILAGTCLAVLLFFTARAVRNIILY